MANAQPVTGLATGTKHRNAVALKWNKPRGATGYVVNYGTSPHQLNGTHVIAGGNNTAAVIGNLQPGTTHYFRVQAQPAKLGSPSSELLSATTEAAV
jgi:hypothetical protein